MQLALPFGRPGPVVTAGARATEDRVLDEVAGHLEAQRKDPRLLRLPVRLVVPSRSLRVHLASALVRRFGHSILGVVVETLNGLARDVVGLAEPGPSLGSVLALRIAAGQDALAPLVHDFDDGDLAIGRSVTQLLDAGFEKVNLAAASDALAGAPQLADGERSRAQALLEVAAGTDEMLRALGTETAGSILRRASARVAHHPPPARAILIHGFADATAVAADFLEALARLPGARVFLDRPPDPASPDQAESAGGFGAGLRGRLGASAAVERATPPATIRVVAAEGPEGEAAELARRIRELLDGGLTPERIGVVARDLDTRAASLRRHLGALAVPWSSPSLAAPDAAPARWRRLVDVLRLGERLPVETWIELLGPLDGVALDPGTRAELRLGLRSVGCARVGQAAALDRSRALKRDGSMALPGGIGLDGERQRRGAVSAERTRALLDAAGALATWCRQLPERAPLTTWVALLDELLGRVLAQPTDHPVRGALVGLSALPPLTWTSTEIRLLLGERLAALGREPAGGAGGGVQVLSVRDARARTFDQLFVLGNHRQSHVPRDAILSDPVRRALREVLPDLPLRRERLDEDRHDFAWLLSSSPEVALFFPSVDARGRPQSLSPLVERLRWASRWETMEEAPDPLAGVGRLPPAAFALATARRGGDPAPSLAAMAEEAWGAPGEGITTAVRARLAVAAERDDRGRPGLGPYLGLAGPGLDVARSPSISLVEDYVSCPWRALVTRILGVDPVRDPLEAVPAADARLTGTLVHRVLERIGRAQLPSRPGAPSVARALEPVTLRWPERDELAALAAEEAQQVLDDEGVLLPGLSALLARRALPFLEQAALHDAAPPVVAVELDGRVVVGDRTVRFRADRADLLDGELLLTDYKTGAGPRPGVDARKELLAAVRRGRRLQAAAYACAEGVAGQVDGRFLYLDPAASQPIVRTSAFDPEWREALDGALTVALEALAAGVFFPRVVKPDEDVEPERCRDCSVAEACLRGEPTDRARLRRWAASSAHDEPFGVLTADHAAMLALWRLPGRGRS